MRGPTGIVRLAIVAVAATVTIAAPTQAAVSDAWITAKTKIALLTSDGVSGTAVDVDTVNGHVTLHGRVASAAARQKAAQVARGIEGVADVRNLLQVVPPAEQAAVERSDEEIETAVAGALASDPDLKDSDVQVQSVNDGVVLLSGTANGLTDHLEAIQIAAGVPGVKRVSSEIESPDEHSDTETHEKASETAEAAKDAVATATGAARDAWITSATKLRLLADTRTPGLAVNVDTRDGEVTLFGMVPTPKAQQAAAEDALRVAGVKAVHDELQVVPAAEQARVKATDRDLERSVTAALARHADLKAADISVDVKNGVARLTGTVPGEQERLTAAVVARTEPGVRAVKDDLRISRR